MSGDKVLTIDNENFEQEVINSDKPVLIDFWASWCGPCRMVAPIIDQLAQQYDGKVKVGKVNVDEQRDIAAKYKVMSIPTIYIFKDGKPVDKVVGARPKSDLETFINNNI